MSLDSRAGLESMILHFGHDSFSSRSLSPAALDGYIVVQNPDRRPLSAKSHNIQRRPISRSGKPAKAGSAVVQDISLTVTSSWPEDDVPMVSRPCTPFQPLPPVLPTSPLRISSFLDLSLDNEHAAPSFKSESPSPQPIFPPISIEIPQFHPNNPYGPWPSCDVLRPLTPSVSGLSLYSRSYSRSGARAPEPQEPDSPPPHNKLLRLSRSFKNLRRTMKEGVKHVKKALRKTSKGKSPEAVPVPARISCPSPIPPPLPSPVASCDSSNTNSLAEWLRACEAKVQRATPHFMTLEEYEERGSWMDLADARDQSEIQSLHASETSEPEQFPSPKSPTCTDASLFPHLSMYDIWPTPPRSDPQDRGFSANRGREMSMPGGWNSTLRDSPASYK
ncbi:hypothetical protein DFH06DRAFT_490328 [Mycena polygramma]|nr:hypothetical protein DFH06DRAFT_490328 [Mycena polygramma]